MSAAAAVAAVAGTLRDRHYREARAPRFWAVWRAGWPLAALLCAVMTLANSALAFWPAAIMVQDQFDANGNSFIIDSFDSSDPNKSYYGSYDPNHPGDNGELTCNGTLTNSLPSFGNANIFGSVSTGTNRLAWIGSSGSIGSHAWQTGHSGIEANGAEGRVWYSHDSSFTPLRIALPYTTGLPPDGPADVVGTTYSIISNYVGSSSAYPNPPPWSGVSTNVVSWTTVSNFPSPVPPGLVTNIIPATSSNYPAAGSYIPGTLGTNTTTATDTNYPASGTYIGSVTANYTSTHVSNAPLPAPGTYVPGSLVSRPNNKWDYDLITSRSYTYNQITGYSYSYDTYSYPTYTYNYAAYTTNAVYSTNHYDRVLNSGDYYSSSSPAGSTVVLGSARLVLSAGLLQASADSITIANGASLIIYSGGTLCAIAGHSIINQAAHAQNVILYCTTTVTNLTFNGDGEFTGVVIAPQANVWLNGAGQANTDFEGVLMANSISLSGHYLFHCDESLASGGPLPPILKRDPADTIVMTGQIASFNVIAGPSPLSYQWRFNGAAIPSATNSSLTITDAGPVNVGSYSVVVANSYGTATSSNAILMVNFPPAISQHPVSQAALLNSNVAFAVTTTGTAPLVYQWRLNGQNVSGATDSSLNIASMQPGNAGTYTVTVTNGYGSVTSDLAGLSVTTPPDFLWARRVTNTVNGYTGTSYEQHMAIDSSGNVFVVGYYHGWGVDFGGAVLTNNSFNATAGGFVCKYDQWGNFVWVRQFSTNANVGLRVATDPGGNVYFVGGYSGTATFGTNVLVSVGSQEMFVAKYDGQGQALWARRIGAYDSNGGYGTAFAVDQGGNAFILSAYVGTADFGATNVSGSPAFLAKYDGAGALVWAKPALGGIALGVGSSGALYIAGPTNFSTASALMAKYDVAGNLVWAKPFAYAQAIALDGAENIYTTGWGRGTYGDLTVTNVGGSFDFFAAKCDSNGNLIWSRQMGSTRQQAGMSIALDAFGNVFVASMTQRATHFGRGPWAEPTSSDQSP